MVAFLFFSTAAKVVSYPVNGDEGPLEELGGIWALVLNSLSPTTCVRRS